MSLQYPLTELTIIPAVLRTHNRLLDFTARWKLGQYFYRASPLVALTRVLLRCKPLLPASRECLSTFIVPEESSVSLHIQPLNKEGSSICGCLSFLPSREREWASRKDFW